jgi:hypothetical protein
MPPRLLSVTSADGSVAGDATLKLFPDSELPALAVPPARSIIAEGLAAVGLQGRTAEERIALADICKEVHGKHSVLDLCEADFPKLLERAKRKLDKLQRSRVLDAVDELNLQQKGAPKSPGSRAQSRSDRQGREPHSREGKSRGGNYQESEVHQLLAMIAESSAAPEDAKKLKAQVPELIHRFRPPCKRRFSLDDIVALVSRLDQQADRLRLDREQQRQAMQGPRPFMPPVSGAASSRSFAYLEACKVPMPKPLDLPAFLPPRAKDMREHTMSKSHSMPHLNRSTLNASSKLMIGIRTKGHDVPMQLTAGSPKKVTFNC